MKILLSSLLSFWMIFSLYSQADSLVTGREKQNNENQAENIFDASHSKKFAEYLYKTGQYDYAIEEFRRVIFLSPYDSDAKSRIVDAYMAKEDFNRAAGFFESYFSPFDTLPVSLQKKGLKIYVILDDFSTAHEYLRRSKMDTLSKQTWMLGLILLQKKWKEAEGFYQKHMDNSMPVYHQFGTALNRRLESKTKSPFLAGTLSAVIPGLGKVYTKNYGDGFMAFLFTGLNLWQAYQGFKKEGVHSVRGWIFGAIGFSFYLGNVYGAVKSAEKYNKKIDDDVTNEVKAVIKYNL
jgi:tetratricopeptide (TPR) repeat protein